MKEAQLGGEWGVRRRVSVKFGLRAVSGGAKGWGGDEGVGGER